MNATTDGARRLVTEEIPVAGNELLSRVRTLMEEGRVRHIKVKSPSGEVYFEVPLAVGLLGGAALAWAAPFLAMAGALAGLVTNVKLEVARETSAADAAEDRMRASADPDRDILGQVKRPPATTKRATARGVAAAKPAPKRATARPRVAKPARAAATRSAASAKRGTGGAAKAGRAKTPAKPKGRR